jgi:hypothetical protein
MVILSRTIGISAPKGEICDGDLSAPFCGVFFCFQMGLTRDFVVLCSQFSILFEDIVGLSELK